MMYETISVIFYNMNVGGDTMLSKTLEDSMTKAMKYEKMTGKPLFGRNFHSGIIQEKEPDMVEKLAPYIKSAQEVANADDEVLNFIVENPDIIAPVFDFEKSESTGLPFFRSIEQKLSVAQFAQD